MLQDDYILRQIREMVRAVMKMLFQVSAPELTPEVIEDKDARQTLEFLEANNFSREEIMMGIQDLADRYNLSGIAEAFRTEIL